MLIRSTLCCVLIFASAGLASANELPWGREISSATRDLLSGFYNRDYVKIHDRNIDWSDPPFAVASANLQAGGNRSPEILVHWKDSFNCGSAGCLLDIWSERDGGYVRIASINVETVRIGETTSRGYRDIWLDDHRFRWDGAQYERR